VEVTLYSIAQRYIGVRELAGDESHPFIQWCLASCFDDLHMEDEVPWCSAFLNRLAWELRLPRSKSALARSWLTVGVPIPIGEARPEFDVVVLSRDEAGPWAGHVGLYADDGPTSVTLLAGNQDNAVSLAAFDLGRVLGVRRLG
jgi:uncharacterized protein (TIGR02594 family)